MEPTREKLDILLRGAHPKSSAGQLYAYAVSLLRQRDELSTKAELLLRALDKVQDWSTTRVGDAMEACEEALRKAGR